MLKTKFYLSFIALFLFSIFSIFSLSKTVLAQEVDYKAMDVPAYDFTSDKTEFRSGNSLVFDQTITGERIGFAEEIVVNGQTEKNLMVAGGKVEINGDVNGSLFAAGGIVIINGKVKGNLYIAASEVYLNSESIDGDIFIAASKNYIPSTFTSTRLHLSNQVRETYTSGSVKKISEVNFTSTNSFNVAPSVENGLNAFGIIFKLIGLISTVIFVYFLLIFFKGQYSKISNILSQNNFGDLFLKAFVGFCIVIGLWIGSFILIFSGFGTILGIFLVLFLLVAWMYCHYISFFLVGSYISKWLPSFTDHRIIIATIGVLAISLFSMIPFIGWIAGVIHFILSVSIFAKLIMNKFEGMNTSKSEIQ